MNNCSQLMNKQVVLSLTFGFLWYGWVEVRVKVGADLFRKHIAQLRAPSPFLPIVRFLPLPCSLFRRKFVPLQQISENEEGLAVQRLSIYGRKGQVTKQADL